MTSLLRFSNHLAGLSTLACCAHYITYRLFEDPKDAIRPDPVRKMFGAKMDMNGGRWRSICNVALLVQLAYTTVALLNDLLAAVVVADSDVGASTQFFTDFLLASLALPGAMLVSSLFWGVYLINVELMAPRVYFQLHPTWLKHGVHTIPLVITLLDLVSMQRPFPSRALTYPPLLVVMVVYFVWLVLYLGVWRNYWIYTVLKTLSWTSRGALCVLIALIFTSFSEMARMMNAYLISTA